MVDDLDRKSANARLATVLSTPLALEDVDEPDALVPRIDAQDFVRVARALRDENRLDLLLGHATAEQLTSLLDLDAWQRDRVDVPQARVWLMLLARLYQAMDKPRGALIDLMYGMDPEMWTLALLPGTEVIDLDPEDDQSRDMAHEQLDHLRTWDTPDGFFVVGVPDGNRRSRPSSSCTRTTSTKGASCCSRFKRACTRRSKRTFAAGGRVVWPTSASWRGRRR